MITSPSQVVTAEQCLRKFAFAHIYRLWEPRKKAQHDGDDLHQLNDNYVRYGLPFDDSPMGELAKLGEPYLPTQEDQPRVEQEDLVTYGAHQYTIKPDVVWMAPRGVIVMDYKTVDHFGFKLTPLKLRANLQACVYAYYAMRLFGEESAWATWLYYKRTKPYEVVPVEVSIEYEDALRVLRANQSLVNVMADLKRTKPPIEEITPTLSFCPKYKGCYYRPKCFPEDGVAA